MLFRSSKVLRPADFQFIDVPVYKQARLATVVSDEAIEALRKRKDFTNAHAEALRSLDGSPWNGLATAWPQVVKTAGLKVPVTQIDAVMKAVGVEDENAPVAVDRKGNPVIADGWKITERVALSEDLDEHMRREVLPFAPDAQWGEAAAKAGNEIPFTRLFYVPEEPRDLTEIDADVKRVMGELAEMFEVVSHE